MYVQPNKYETDQYNLQIFQCDTSVCLNISVFCKSCEPMLCEPEIVLVLICPLAEQFHVHRSYETHESTMLCVGNFEENIDLSHIYLAVHKIYYIFQLETKFHSKIRVSNVQFLLT